jgi:hypothetical protein
VRHSIGICADAAPTTGWFGPCFVPRREIIPRDVRR